MPIIYSYPKGTSIVDSDSVLGTDQSNKNNTVTYTMVDIKDYVLKDLLDGVQFRLPIYGKPKVLTNSLFYQNTAAETGTAILGDTVYLNNGNNIGNLIVAQNITSSNGNIVSTVGDIAAGGSMAAGQTTADPNYRLKVNGASNFTGAIIADSTLTVGGVATFNAAVQANSTVNIVNTLTADGTSNLNGIVRLGGSLPSSTSGIFLNRLTYLNSDTTLDSAATLALQGPIKDSSGVLGSNEQVLVSDANGKMSWQFYQSSGLEFQSAWDASEGLPPLPTSEVTLANVGKYWVVSVAGNTNLGGITDWEIGDWAIISKDSADNVFWGKIDNSAAITGTGTNNTLTKWTGPTTLGNSIVSESGTTLTIAGNTTTTGDVQIDTLTSGYIPFVDSPAGDVLRDSGFYQVKAPVTSDNAIGLNTTKLDSFYGEYPDLRVASRSLNDPGVLDLFRPDGDVQAGDRVGILQYSLDDDTQYAVAQIEVKTIGNSGTGNTGGGKLCIKTSTNQAGAQPTERLCIDNTEADFSVPINVTGDIKLGQYESITFGDITDSDNLRIENKNGLGASIRQSGPGSFFLYGESQVVIASIGPGGLGQEDLARFKEDGPVELYYDNNKKFETTSTGIEVTGTQSSFTGQVTIPATPVAATDAASKAYVDSQSGVGGVTSIIAGTNVTISPAGGTGDVTINASGSGSGGVSGNGDQYNIAVWGDTTELSGLTSSIGLPTSTSLTAGITTQYTGLGAQGPGSVPTLHRIRNYNGSGSNTSTYLFNQTGTLKVSGDNGGRIDVGTNPANISGSALNVGTGVSTFKGGVIISNSPGGVQVDNSSLVVGSGTNDNISGSDHCLIVGSGNQIISNSDQSVAFGQGNAITSSIDAFAVGNSNTLTSSLRTQALGFNNTITASSSFIAGGGNSITANANIFALGDGHTVTTTGSTEDAYLIGTGNTITGGTGSFAIGSNLDGDAGNHMVVGYRNNKTSYPATNYSLGLGNTKFALAVGSTTTTNSNALLITEGGVNRGGGVAQVPRIVLPTISGFSATDDTAAGAIGIPLGGLYQSNGNLRINTGSIVINEGSWTPTIGAIGASNFSFNPIAGGANVGYYIIQGNIMTAWFTIPGTATWSGTAGFPLITGLPYAFDNTLSSAAVLSADIGKTSGLSAQATGVTTGPSNTNLGINVLVNNNSTNMGLNGTGIVNGVFFSLTGCIRYKLL